MSATTSEIEGWSNCTEPPEAGFYNTYLTTGEPGFKNLVSPLLASCSVESMSKLSSLHS